jgi:hypothetical protein
LQRSGTLQSIKSVSTVEIIDFLNISTFQALSKKQVEEGQADVIELLLNFGKTLRVGK